MTRKQIELQDRNLRIVQMAKTNGYQAVADHFGITRSRVSQIVAEYNSEVSDDGARDQLTGRLESYLDDVINPILQGPGQLAYSTGSGKLIEDPDGNPIYDQRVKLDAVKVGVTVIERLAKMGALDRPKPREKDEAEAVSEALAFMDALAAQNKELAARVARYESGGIVTAEVVAPIVSE